MGQGLGKESPVQLRLGKDNYEALIERHGQWVRWRTALKCSCVKSENMQPDIHCSICAGRGYLYSFQKSQIVYQVVMITDVTGKTIEVKEDYSDCSLIEVYDVNGRRFPGAEKLNTFIKLNYSGNITKGTYFTVVMRQYMLQTIASATATKDNLGYYTVPGLTKNQASTEGVYYSASGDIESIGTITDAAGITYTAKEYRLNQFRIEPTTSGGVEVPITEPVTVTNVKYLPPFVFALLNQNLSKADTQSMVEMQGDAIVTYPYGLDVSNDDVITVLSGSYTQKEVMIRSEYDTDTLGVYFVYDVVICTGIINGALYEYKQGTDFILVENNKIKWLTTGTYPDEGETYSITYHVLPTYKVVKPLPQLRTSENQRFPKKAVVKLNSTYSEKLAANKQVVGRNGFDGSY